MSNYTSQEQLEIIEQSTKDAQEKVALMEAAQALMKNRHFKRLFLEHYMKAYPLRLIPLKASPTQMGQEQQTFITSQLDAIGHLDQFLRYVEMDGLNAQRLIEQNQNEAELIRAESEAM